jgi:hypothetical protein
MKDYKSIIEELENNKIDINKLHIANEILANELFENITNENLNIIVEYIYDLWVDNDDLKLTSLITAFQNVFITAVEEGETELNNFEEYINKINVEEDIEFEYCSL